jgi:putative Holliday junction resolvase
MKYLGIDYGAKRIGIAVSDTAGTIAFPRATVSNDGSLMSYFEVLIESEDIGAIVMGDTKTHGGKANPISVQADAFADMLADETGLTVNRSWELWSSMEVGKLATKGHEHDDAAAAAFILQRYLDMNSTENTKDTVE